jgi:transposase
VYDLIEIDILSSRHTPQFNPIEQLWRELKRLLKLTPPTGPLDPTILESLQKITQEQVTGFIGMMVIN